MSQSTLGAAVCGPNSERLVCSSILERASSRHDRAEPTAFDTPEVFLVGLCWLLLHPPTPFNCVYRVNCDTTQSLNAKSLTALAAFSAGGVGGCFLGPQVRVWQEEMSHQGYGFPPHASSQAEEQYWLPDKETLCVPPAGFNTSAYDSPEVSQFGCEGPNNCFSWDFKLAYLGLLFVFVVLNHLFTKLVLLGVVAEKLRKMQRKDDRGSPWPMGWGSVAPAGFHRRSISEFR